MKTQVSEVAELGKPVVRLLDGHDLLSEDDRCDACGDLPDYIMEGYGLLLCRRCKRRVSR